MNEIFATRKDWLVRATLCGPRDVIRITPTEGLSVRDIMAAMRAQGILLTESGAQRWYINDHGSSILLQQRHSN